MSKECRMTIRFWVQTINYATWWRREVTVAHMLAVMLSVFCATQSQLAKSEESLILEAARQAEEQLDARVGLALYDTENGASWLYNANERFPMASTFKVLACGALLARSDGGFEDLNRPVPINQS